MVGSDNRQGPTIQCSNIEESSYEHIGDKQDPVLISEQSKYPVVYRSHVNIPLDRVTDGSESDCEVGDELGEIKASPSAQLTSHLSQKAFMKP